MRHAIAAAVLLAGAFLAVIDGRYRHARVLAVAALSAGAVGVLRRKRRRERAWLRGAPS